MGYGGGGDEGTEAAACLGVCSCVYGLGVSFHLFDLGINLNLAAAAGGGGSVLVEDRRGPIHP